jgi:PEP-CTERM motif-containing protein
MFKKLLIGAVLVAGSATASAGPVLLTEGFDTFALPGWLAGNLSAPVGATAWFPGNTGVFDAESGAADSYIAANYLASDGGSVDLWLVTPLLTALDGGALLTFSTRTGGALPGDNLEILYNATGSLFTADYISLGSIGAYPTDWSVFNFLYNGGVADVRFAFRYTVADTLTGGDYIGIDSVSVRSVPEPGTLALLATALLIAPLVARRRRASSQA